MDAFEKKIEAGGTTYTFKLPSSKDVINIDLKALELRKGVTEGLGNGYVESQNVALLSTLCKSPTDTDFSELPVHMVDYLADEVAAWSNSFRENLGKQKSATDSGSNG